MISQYSTALNASTQRKGSNANTTLYLNQVYPQLSIPRGVWQSASKTISVRNWTRNVIIAKTEKSELTQWFSSFVYRRKQNGRLRLHLNAKDLNAAIQIEHHVTLTLEEILLNVKDAKVFSIRKKKCEYRNVFPGKEVYEPHYIWEIQVQAHAL